MHRVFVTDGLVLGKRPAGESNTAIFLLTEELGLVRATARSARKEVSKLRFGLELLTAARFSLVRGRFEWKLIGVEAISRALLCATSPRRGQIGRVSRLLLRLIHGEEPVPELYATVCDGLLALVHTPEQSDADALECVLVMRIMAHLGYLPHSPEFAHLLESQITAKTLSEAKQARFKLIRIINESLTATGL